MRPELQLLALIRLIRSQRQLAEARRRRLAADLRLRVVLEQRHLVGLELRRWADREPLLPLAHAPHKQEPLTQTRLLHLPSQGRSLPSAQPPP